MNKATRNSNNDVIWSWKENVTMETEYLDTIPISCKWGHFYYKHSQETLHFWIQTIYCYSGQFKRNIFLLLWHSFYITLAFNKKKKIFLSMKKDNWSFSELLNDWNLLFWKYLKFYSQLIFKFTCILRILF